MSGKPNQKNLKRKHSEWSACNTDPGNCTPSDSDSDDEYVKKKVLKKVAPPVTVNGAGSKRRDVVQQDHAVDETLNGSISTSLASTSDGTQSGGVNNHILREALQKIHELENELAALDDIDYDSGHHEYDDEDDDDHRNDNSIDETLPTHCRQHHSDQLIEAQTEALGFAFCVKETFEFLAAQGVTENDPIVLALRDRFLGKCNE